MKKIQAWMSVFRFRTLLLSFSLIIMGATLAYSDGIFDSITFVLAMLTTLFLQILSNISNDYGDSSNGVDNENRVGPHRAIQNGAITLNEMRRAIYLLTILSLVSGVFLLIKSYSRLTLTGFVIMLCVGLLSIIAAICYTVGRRPYGYRGFGDLSTFIFFGIVGVEGSYIVFTGDFSGPAMLPASAIGLLSVGVLNMNNMRDYQSDKQTGKKTLIVKFGLHWGKIYQTIVITLSYLLIVAYILIYGRLTQLLSLISMLILIAHLIIVWRQKDNQKLDTELKKVSIGTLFMVISFTIGTFIAK